MDVDADGKVAVEDLEDSLDMGADKETNDDDGPGSDAAGSA